MGNVVSCTGAVTWVRKRLNRDGQESESSDAGPSVSSEEVPRRKSVNPDVEKKKKEEEEARDKRRRLTELYKEEDFNAKKIEQDQDAILQKERDMMIAAGGMEGLFSDNQDNNADNSNAVDFVHEEPTIWEDAEIIDQLNDEQLKESSLDYVRGIVTSAAEQIVKTEPEMFLEGTVEEALQIAFPSTKASLPRSPVSSCSITAITLPDAMEEPHPAFRAEDYYSDDFDTPAASKDDITATEQEDIRQASEEQIAETAHELAMNAFDAVVQKLSSEQMDDYFVLEDEEELNITTTSEVNV